MKKVKDLITALTVPGNTRLGKDLITAAAEVKRADAQKKVVDSVAQLLTQIEGQRKIIAQAERAIAVYDARLDAINDGKFTINSDGELVLNDTKLAPLGLIDERSRQPDRWGNK